MSMISKPIQAYNNTHAAAITAICDKLAEIIDSNLPGSENKVWHGHPVWFINENPIVGYHKLKGPVRLMFWSGQSFDEPALTGEGTFKAAEIRYEDIDDINVDDLLRWLEKAQTIQWDYKNIVKRRGELVQL